MTHITNHCHIITILIHRLYVIIQNVIIQGYNQSNSEAAAVHVSQVRFTSKSRRLQRFPVPVLSKYTCHSNLENALLIPFYGNTVLSLLFRIEYVKLRSDTDWYVTLCNSTEFILLLMKG